MKRICSLLIFGGMLLFAPAVLASGQATPEEAREMAIKAAEYLKANGPEKAFPEFSAKDGPWHDRDLYVTVQDRTGVMRAHGTNPGLIGKSLVDLRDVDGKVIFHEKMAIVDSGWINYKWQNPVTKAVEMKTAFQVRVGDFVVAVGAYAQ